MRAPERSDAYTASGMSVLGDRRGASAPVAAPPVGLTDDDLVPEGLSVLATRSASGFDVQLLIDGEGCTYVTCILNGAIETFEVARASAYDAFHHPFLFGCTLPL